MKSTINDWAFCGYRSWELQRHIITHTQFSWFKLVPTVKTETLRRPVMKNEPTVTLMMMMSRPPVMKMATSESQRLTPPKFQGWIVRCNKYVKYDCSVITFSVRKLFETWCFFFPTCWFSLVLRSSAGSCLQNLIAYILVCWISSLISSTLYSK